jgi:hypothetical protein
MPALAQALSGALPEAALRQLMQALGNCQQPLTHRGAINLQPPTSTGAGALARPGTWNPSDYSGLMPSAGQSVTVDVAGNTINNTNTQNYDGHQFSFPINQAFNYSNYFGGDTFNVAGNSTFANSFHNNLTVDNSRITNLTVETLTINNPAAPQPVEPGGGGGMGPGEGGGGEGGGGFGGGPFFFPLPAVTQVSTFLKDVTVRGTVSVNEAGTVTNKTVDVTNKVVSTPVSVTGTVTVPTVESVSLTAFSASGTASLATLTGGTVSGGTASGAIVYTTHPTATCGAITGSVTRPTGGTFNVTPTGIAVAATIGTLAGTVVIPMPTGGYLDANCKLVLTTTNQTYTVNMAGSPGVTISSQGKVSGPVTLTGTTTVPVTISTPSVSLTSSTASVTPTLSVAGIAFSPTTGSTNAAVTITKADATLTIKAGTTSPPFEATGSILVKEAETAALRDNAVTIKSGAVTKTLNLTVGKKSDFIIYLRPRI